MFLFSTSFCVGLTLVLLLSHSSCRVLNILLITPPLKKFVTLCSEKTALATRSVTRGRCSIPKRRNQFGSSSFSCVAMSQWNDLYELIYSVGYYYIMLIKALVIV